MKTLFILKFKSVNGQDAYITTSIENLGNYSAETAIAMQYIGKDTWAVPLDIPKKHFKYYYLIKDKRDNTITAEWGERTFEPFIKSKNFIIQDTWNCPTLPEFNLTTRLFKNIMPAREIQTSRTLKKHTHRFTITFPVFNEEEELVLLGDADGLHFWNEQDPLRMHYAGNGKWFVDADLSAENNYSAYKYAVYNTRSKAVVYFEEGENRWVAPNQNENKILIINDNGFKQPEFKRWRGSGIAVPVFSLRTRSSIGVGEFLDLIPLGEWCKKTGFSLIQLLPVHDTTATHSWNDCYPYAAISIFALHPMYLNLENLNYKLTAKEQSEIQQAKERLNAEQGVEYEAVNKFKNEFLDNYFNKHFSKIEKHKGFQLFIEKNKEWLKPYAVFSVLRDQYKTIDFNYWKKHKKTSIEEITSFFGKKHKHYKKVLKYAYIQWQLHLQLSQAVQALHSMGVGLKGDLPIGVLKNSVDAWVNPASFHMHQQAGAPPDSFSTIGQNWEFPTYNWAQMQQNHFKWWKRRFSFMEQYFDAFRIDHILGFFRIWQIPAEQIQGILGKFEPAIPIHYNELENKGVHLSPERLTKPFINKTILEEYFGTEVTEVEALYFDKKNEREYQLKPEFSTQRNIVKALGAEHPLLEKLFDIVANVLFIPDENSQEHYHPRFELYKTKSFAYLSPQEKEVLSTLHEDYFFRRQEQFWKEKGLERLPTLKQSTNMLTCGEDLGLVPQVVPEVMNALAILSLEIQRMPKTFGALFSHPADAAYLSVVSPSSHDTSTLRQWWKENKEKTQYFYNHLMGHYGLAPEELSPNLQEEILHQHLFSPAMLCIIPIQEFLGISAKLRNPNEDEERINIPSVFPHKWRYRMHITLEDLLAEEDFNNKLMQLHVDCGRI